MRFNGHVEIPILGPSLGFSPISFLVLYPFLITPLDGCTQPVTKMLKDKRQRKRKGKEHTQRTTQNTSFFSLLLIVLAPFLALGLLLVLVFVFEAAGRNLVQAKDGLVGVLDEDELAVVSLETHVGNGSDDTPAVREGQVHLVSEVAGLPANDAENDVLVVGAGVDTRNESVSQ